MTTINLNKERILESIERFKYRHTVNLFLGEKGQIDSDKNLSQRKKRFGLKISNGLNYLSGGDWNTYMKLDTKLNKDLANMFGYDLGGEFKEIHTGFNLEAEGIVYLTPRLGISIGSGYIYGKKGEDSSKIVTHLRLFTETLTHDTKISAIPLKLSAYYFLPVSSKASVYLNAGLGYYLAKFSDDYRHEWDGYWEVIKQTADGGNFGLHGGIGFEYSMTQFLSLVIETGGRYAKISRFEGYYDYKNSNNWADYYKGTLYYYEFDLTWMGLDWYPEVKISDQKPSSPSIRNVHKASIDFSGFTLGAGIKIRF